MQIVLLFEKGSGTLLGGEIVGQDVVLALQVGEPPANPDLMTKVQVLADIPQAQRPVVNVLDTKSKSFAALVDRVRKEKGADFSICDIEIPSQVR